MPAATKLLRRAIELDPNYAPAHATLALAQYHSIPAAREARPKWRQGLEADARRAIALAPNLAIGHAALGLVLPPGPEAEAAIRRAVELNPNDADSLNWLAWIEQGKGRTEMALELFNRAATIEPLSSEVVLGRLSLLLSLKRDSEVERELGRLQKSGAVALNGLARLIVLEARGDLSEAARAGLEAYKASSLPDRGLLGVRLAATLLNMQLNDVAFRVTPVPTFSMFMWSNDPRVLPFIERLPMGPEDFWSSPPMTQLVTRNLVYHGRDRELVRLYKEGAGSPEKLAEVADGMYALITDGPLVAMALRRTGDTREAEGLLAFADQKLTETMKDSINRGPGPLVRMARIRAVQGRRQEAAELLAQAVKRGWLGSVPAIMPELLHDPPLALLKDTPEFREARAHILRYVARERAELGPVDLESVPMATRPTGPLGPVR